MPDFEDWGFYDGKCQACDDYGRVNDLSLCQTCGEKLERDMIRERNWDHSASAFGVAVGDREKLRQQVIKKYGRALELIAPSKKDGKAKKKMKG